VQETQDIETNRRECGQQMTDEQQQQLIDELKADPESALSFSITSASASPKR
jgi:hypothetical protein